VREGVQEPPAEAASQHRGLWSAAMQPGAVIGEAALLAHTRRTVSVYANPGSTLLCLSRESHAAAVGCPPPLPVTNAIYRMLKVREASVVLLLDSFVFIAAVGAVE
jgi:CRP-like cAMP-binding protein